MTGEEEAAAAGKEQSDEEGGQPVAAAEGPGAAAPAAGAAEPEPEPAALENPSHTSAPTSPCRARGHRSWHANSPPNSPLKAKAPPVGGASSAAPTRAPSRRGQKGHKLNFKKPH